LEIPAFAGMTFKKSGMTVKVRRNDKGVILNPTNVILNLFQDLSMIRCCLTALLDYINMYKPFGYTGHL
jgi:hypothetical protein